MRKLLKRLFNLRTVRTLISYALIFLLAGFIGNIWMTRSQVSGVLPSFSAKDLHGQAVELEFLQSRLDLPQFNPENSNQLLEPPILLYFFAEWCPICKLQHSAISAVSQDYQVIGIAMQSGDSQAVKKYAAEQGIEFTIINDESGRISNSFGVNGVPAAFIIDQSGKIQYSTRGYATEAGLRSRLWLAGR